MCSLYLLCRNFYNFHCWPEHTKEISFSFNLKSLYCIFQNHLAIFIHPGKHFSWWKHIVIIESFCWGKHIVFIESTLLAILVLYTFLISSLPVSEISLWKKEYKQNKQATDCGNLYNWFWWKLYRIMFSSWSG